MNANVNRDKLIDKIRKLLALAGSNSNEHEAASAAERAQALLAEYNLSMTDVDGKSTNADDKTTEDRELLNESFPWKRNVGSAVGKMFFCGYFFIQKKVVDAKGKVKRMDQHVFLGAAHNITVTKQMFIYLVDTVERLARESALKVPAKDREAYRRAFMWACTKRLCYRIYDQNNVKNYLDDQKVKLKTYNRGGQTSSFSGTVDGNAAGHKIGLDQQVGGKQNQRMLSR